MFITALDTVIGFSAELVCHGSPVVGVGVVVVVVGSIGTYLVPAGRGVHRWSAPFQSVYWCRNNWGPQGRVIGASQFHCPMDERQIVSSGSSAHGGV